MTVPPMRGSPTDREDTDREPPLASSRDHPGFAIGPTHGEETSFAIFGACPTKTGPVARLP